VLPQWSQATQDGRSTVLPTAGVKLLRQHGKAATGLNGAAENRAQGFPQRMQKRVININGPGEPNGSFHRFSIDPSDLIDFYGSEKVYLLLRP
jgi:hypothetical protein